MPHLLPAQMAGREKSPASLPPLFWQDGTGTLLPAHTFFFHEREKRLTPGEKEEGRRRRAGCSEDLVPCAWGGGCLSLSLPAKTGKAGDSCFWNRTSTLHTHTQLDTHTFLWAQTDILRLSSSFLLPLLLPLRDIFACYLHGMPLAFSAAAFFFFFCLQIFHLSCTFCGTLGEGAFPNERRKK